MFRKIISMLLIATIIICTASVAFAKSYGYPDLTQYEIYFDRWPDGTFFVTNCKEWISVWSEPYVNSERLGILPKGTRINYFDYYNDQFIKYYLNNGDYGFVNLDYLSSDFDDAAKLYVSNCDSWVSLWSEPYIGSERIGKVPRHTVIEYWSNYSEDFISCDLGGDGGYISWDYLKYKK